MSVVPTVPIVAEPTKPEAALFRAELEGDISERAAIAEIEGHVAPVFTLAFAAFQIGCPAGHSVEVRRRAVDDAGRLLDRHGHDAAAFGWLAYDLFDADGLAWNLNGAAVVSLTPTAVVLSDGRFFKRRGDGP